VTPHKPDERSVWRRHDRVSPNAAISALELHDGELPQSYKEPVTAQIVGWVSVTRRKDQPLQIWTLKKTKRQGRHNLAVSPRQGICSS
jgi:hypothetical protein